LAFLFTFVNNPLTPLPFSLPPSTLQQYKESLRDFKHVVKVHPRDKDAVAKLRECEKAVRLKQMTASESQSLVRLYESGINGYTYLEPEN